jgi:hypothetical protein
MVYCPSRCYEVFIRPLVEPTHRISAETIGDTARTQCEPALLKRMLGIAFDNGKKENRVLSRKMDVHEAQVDRNFI